MSSRDEFLDCLQKVHHHYNMWNVSATNEGLTEYQGPQDFKDVGNIKMLHYYGKAWYEWYKKSIFETQMENIFDIDTQSFSKIPPKCRASIFQYRTGSPGKVLKKMLMQ